ncbi:MAG: methylated-DNA--[protein]-cysteine S-methyltransferase [Mariprofundaceae bacterium]
MWRWMDTPIGAIAWLEDENGRCVRLEPGSRKGAPGPTGPVAAWLQSYFRHCTPTEPPVAPPATDFQARLRAALLAIPPGNTRTYGELARRLGSSPRAVGQALRANPQPILIPCHRIVAANGLGGFSAGIEWKRRLLAFERPP